MEYKLRESEWGLSIVEAVLKNRGLTKTRVDKILNPSSEVIENAFNYRNMDICVQKVLECVKSNKKIGILVDSDVDGYTSSSILYQFLTSELKYHNIEIIFHNESKVHGLTEDVMYRVLNSDIKLLVTPDSSSSDVKQQLELLLNGIDFIALDHHEYSLDKIPFGAIVVNNQDGIVNNVNLAGVGVTYKFIEAICKTLEINLGCKYLDLVAVGNIADVIDLRELETRYYVMNGLKNIENKFIKALLDKAGIEEPTITHISFNVSNYMNAVIRVGNDEEKEQLWYGLAGVSGDIADIVKICNRVKSRQDRLVKNILVKIQDRAEEKKLLDNKVLIVNTTDIGNNSVGGLIATKLANEYKRPVMLFTINENGVCSGSARGYGESSFKDICEKSGLFSFLGGHANAFGHSTHIENLIKANTYFNDTLADMKLEKIYEVDTVFNINDLNLNTIMEVGELSELWCSHIKEPLFVVKDIKLHSSEIQRFGSATYSFTKNDYMQFSRNFCKKTIYEEAIFKDSHPHGCDLVMDAIVKFVKNQKGFTYIEVVDWSTKINEEIIF